MIDSSSRVPSTGRPAASNGSVTSSTAFQGRPSFSVKVNRDPSISATISTDALAPDRNGTAAAVKLRPRTGTGLFSACCSAALASGVAVVFVAGLPFGAM